MFTNALLIVSLIILSGAICVEGSKPSTDGMGPFSGMMVTFVFIAFALINQVTGWF